MGREAENDEKVWKFLFSNNGDIQFCDLLVFLEFHGFEVMYLSG